MTEVGSFAEERRQLEELVSILERSGVQFWVDRDAVRFRAPAGILTREIEARLRGSQEQLRALLHTRKSADRVTSAATDLWEPSDSQAGLASVDGVDNVIIELRWDGFPFSAPAFNQALQAMLARHGILRTCYVRDDTGRLWARTEPEVSPPVHT